ncbi:thioredoxin [Paenibacillus chitinolyticus]|uniref:thioredoxin family protein n=1 Tax=Paenibacillus chitinolyticus TaxID=79263 RepID=UPI0026E49A40|nr:thioredoxin domain-containing protein [Paenibacillus chitinolyticus]GKS15105.1 thioredoxin [Paenibacillus chitinolyticus]
MAIYNVTDATLKNELLSEGLTVVNFWASWCSACLIFSPILEAYDVEGNNEAKILKANLEDNAQSAAFFGIMSIPATIIFKDGEAVDKEIGVMSVERLKQFIARNQ